jgi:hypothetical protein
MEMVQPFQEEVTELHNYTTLNIFLANARVYAAKSGAVEDTLELTPGRVVKLNTDDIRNSIMEIKMSEVYPSAFQAQGTAIQLAERRVGTSGAAGMLAKGGSRTPGVTALSLLQQVNRRFAPAFDDMREKTAAAVRQSVYRYRERLRANDEQLKNHVVEIMDRERAELVFDLLAHPDFEKAVSVELTASSVSINREADRQNAMLVTNMMNGYYQQIAALALQAAQQNVPDNVKEVLVEAAKKGTELMDRTLRTFEFIRDPKTFLVDPTKVESTIMAPPAQDALTQLVQAIAQTGAKEEPMPSPGFSGVA